MDGTENGENGHSKDNRENRLPVFINEQIARVPTPSPGSYEAPNQESRLGEIADKLKDPKCSPGEVIRLINHEIALVMLEMRACEREPSAAESKRKSCMAQITALNRWARTLEAFPWTKHEVLNFDGPKFRFVIAQFSNCFKDAALEVLKGDEATVQMIMRLSRDIAVSREEEVRRAAEKIADDGNAPSTVLPRQEPNKRGEIPQGKNPQRPETSPAAQPPSDSPTPSAARDGATANRLKP